MKNRKINVKNPLLGVATLKKASLGIFQKFDTDSTPTFPDLLNDNANGKYTTHLFKNLFNI